MKLDLPRFAFTPTETQGILRADDWSCFTIEQPWLRWSYPGGKPFNSCIPDGTYELLPYIRNNEHRDRAFAIVNESLGVYFQDADRPTDSNGGRHGRFKCLVHGRANYVGDVQGCVAVGKERQIHRSRHEVMVTNSTVTMNSFIDLIGWEHGHTLRIFQAPGAVDTPLVTL